MNFKPFLTLAALATVTAADTNTLTIHVNPLEMADKWLVTNNEFHVTERVLMFGEHAIMFSTNRVTNVLSILSTLPVPGTCPECGAPNHHMAQVRLLSAYDVIYLTATSPGHSNTMQIATGSATNWVATNLIPRTVQPYASPGWPTSVPPLPK